MGPAGHRREQPGQRRAGTDFDALGAALWAGCLVWGVLCAGGCLCRAVRRARALRALRALLNALPKLLRRTAHALVRARELALRALALPPLRRGGAQRARTLSRPAL